MVAFTFQTEVDTVVSSSTVFEQQAPFISLQNGEKC